MLSHQSLSRREDALQFASALRLDSFTRQVDRRLEEVGPMADVHAVPRLRRVVGGDEGTQGSTCAHSSARSGHTQEGTHRAKCKHTGGHAIAHAGGVVTR